MSYSCSSCSSSSTVSSTSSSSTSSSSNGGYKTASMQRASTNTLQSHQTAGAAPHLHRRDMQSAPGWPRRDARKSDQFTRITRDTAAQSCRALPLRVMHNARLSTPASPNQTKSRSLQQIVEGLYIAYEDEAAPFDVSASEGLRTSSGQAFTHIVNLSARTTITEDQWPRRNVDVGGACRLAVPLPEWTWAQRVPRSRQPKHTDEELLKVQEALASMGDFSLARLRATLNADTSGEGMPSLSRDQLICARDFLVTSGFDLMSVPFTPEIRMRKRLLITCPRSREVEAMALVTCFFAFVTGDSPFDMLTTHDEMEEIAPEWKGVVSKRAVPFIERAAR